jgi:flagellar hook protein FlgE
MNVNSSVSLSGMNAAQMRLQATAHNIANLETQGFNRQEVTQSTQAAGGTSAMVANAAGSGSALETDMVQQLQAKNAFLANLSVFKTSNAVLGTLLNISA